MLHPRPTPAQVREDHLAEVGPLLTEALALAVEGNPLDLDFRDVEWRYVETPLVEETAEGRRLARIPARTAHLHLWCRFQGVAVEAMIRHDAIGRHHVFRVHGPRGAVAFGDLASFGAAVAATR